MENKWRGLPVRRGDVLLCAALLLCSGAIALWMAMGSQADYALIGTQEGARRYALSAGAAAFTVPVQGNGHDLLIQIDGLRARILEADCPDQVCVSTGWLDRTGQIAVCVPARVTLRLGGGRSDVDAVLR